MRLRGMCQVPTAGWTNWVGSTPHAQSSSPEQDLGILHWALFFPSPTNHQPSLPVYPNGGTWAPSWGMWPEGTSEVGVSTADSGISSSESNQVWAP